MARTRGRAIPTGNVSSTQTMVFATLLGGSGLAILYFYHLQCKTRPFRAVIRQRSISCRYAAIHLL